MVVKRITNAGPEHHGKYVATAGFNSQEIIAFGKDAGKVIDEARKLGHEQPIIMFIRDPKITYIYSLSA